MPRFTIGRGFLFRTNKMELSKSKSFHSDIFGELTVLRDTSNNGWFIGKEIAEKLGYARPSDAIAQHCRHTVKHRIKTNQHDTVGSEFNIMPEPDLYRLIFGSKLDSAIKFQDWVFEEVLPQIRMLGLYATDDVIEKMLADKEWGTQLLIRVRDRLNKPNPITSDQLRQDFKALTGIEVDHD